MKRKSEIRIIALLLVFLMLVSIIPVNSVYAQEETQVADIAIEEVNAFPGDTVEVAVTIKNNPGILGAFLKLEYDEGLTLSDV